VIVYHRKTTDNKLEGEITLAEHFLSQASHSSINHSFQCISTQIQHFCGPVT